MWIGFIWLRIGTGDGFLLTRQWNFGFHKGGEFLDKLSVLLVSQGLGYIELVWRSHNSKIICKRVRTVRQEEKVTCREQSRFRNLTKVIQMSEINGS
jgi:hypothetical protein